MIRHVVMFRWKDEVADEQVAAASAALAGLPALIPQLVSYTFGSDLGLAANNFDFAVVAEVASVADFEAYRDDANHQAVIRDHLAPMIAQRVAVQYNAT